MLNKYQHSVIAQTLIDLELYITCLSALDKGDTPQEVLTNLERCKRAQGRKVNKYKHQYAEAVRTYNNIEVAIDWMCTFFKLERHSKPYSIDLDVDSERPTCTICTEPEASRMSDKG